MDSGEKFYKFEQTSDVPIENNKKTKSCTRERICWIFLVLLLIGAVVGVSVYFTQKDKDDSAADGKTDEQTGDKATKTTVAPTKLTSAVSTASPTTTRTPDVDEMLQRVDCIPEAQGGVVEATQELCKRRRCLYSDSGKPACYFSAEQGYMAKEYENTNLGFRVYLEKKVDGPFGDDFQEAVFNVEMRGDSIIRFTFDDPVFNRYKVPLKVDLPKEKANTATAKYEMKITSNETFAFQVIRKSTGTVLWDTGVGGLVLSDQFLQISTKLPSMNVYGFGENLHDSFRHDLNFTTWPMFSRDQSPSHWEYANLYGVHPFYTCQENDGNSHGVFLLNSNAMDYSFNPLPMLTYRTIGGILDFYMFLGPEPENVVQQYTGVIGRPYMPPYWALGFQICRYGYKNTSEIRAVVEDTKMYNIPHDVQYADIDHFDKNMDFTLDRKNFGDLPEYFNGLRENGMRTIIILDPALDSNQTGYEPYDNLTAIRGSVMWPDDVIVDDEDKDSTGALLGYVWPSGKSVFPDFFKKETQDLWERLIVKHRNVVPFDALWIDMNEPANFGTNEEKPWNWPDNVEPWSLKCPVNNRYEDPPYRTKAAYGFDDNSKQFEGRLSDKSICMISRQGKDGEYRHYDVHSLYGWSEAPPTLRGARAATGERSFVLTRSSYPGSGKYAGHWLGDNDADWSDLRKSVIGMLEFNLFGIPYVGADICGYWNNGSPELCKRWLQLGAFYPFSRNHNQKDAKDNHPTIHGPDVANAAREALETRYWLLPYLYTLFHKAHTEGGTVVRALFHEFPEDDFTYSIDRQFMWGKALMIAPILEQGLTEVNTYLPDGPWYNFYDGTLQKKITLRQVSPSSNIGLYVRGGHILPMQRPANNTAFSRKNPLKLLIALDNQKSAEGELFWDDGTSVDTYETGNYFFAKFKAMRNSISMSVEHDNTPDLTYLYFEELQIYGAPDQVTRLYYDGKDLSFTNKNGVLTVSNLNIPLTRAFTVYWSQENEDERMRHDCFPESWGGFDKVTKETCEERGCIYQPDVSQGPTCYINLDNYGYKIVGDRIETEFGFKYHLTHRGRNNPFSHLGSPDVTNIIFTVEMRGNDVLRFKFEDPSEKRYEVPVRMNLASNKALMPRYKVKVTGTDPFAFQVIRISNEEILWDTGIGGLTFSNQFLQISTKLPSKNIYGFGENVHHSLRHDLNYRTWPMWSRDQPTGWGGNLNHYGVHPFYMCVEDRENGGHTHGVLLLNSNAQDYSFNPLPMLTYRTIGGVLDFYMFLGPEPENVVQQYTGAVGRPYMPAYWSLGFQLCRYGYNSIENLKDAVEKTKSAGIPHDVQYADIDHMHTQMDFTVDDQNFPGLNDYFKSLQQQGMHIIIILDPTLITNVSGYEPYERMRDTDSNIKWPDGENIPAGSINEKRDLLGYVWPPGKVVFPDFFKNSTKAVWQELIVKHHNNNLTFDGLWIDMNEPANFGTNEERPWNWPEDARPYWSLNCTKEGNTYEHPPYRTMAAYAHDGGHKRTMISEKTICMRAVQGDSDIYKQYDVHSLYGWSQTEPTLDGLRKATGERGIVISRSTFPSSGKHAGHWLGDNDSVWPDLRFSIIGSLEFNLFGIPYIGADICGFMQNTTAELCKRWMQLGAFYTFSRNHNGINYMRQDPGSFGPDVAEASKVAMETRYRLLPYLYTLFHKAHTEGHTVMRPLHHEFADDEMTFDLDKQFLWGPSLMISPILYEGQTSINIYVPRGPWYDFYTGEEVTTQSGYVTLPVHPDSKIPLHVRAGHIIPMQAPANNTHFSRKNPFTLLVALKDSENGGRGYTAKGDLFWDDGVSVDTVASKKYFYARFSSGKDTLSLTVEHTGPSSSIDGLNIDTVKVYGVRTNVKHIYIGDKEHFQFRYNETTRVLLIESLGLPVNQDFQLEWREFRRPSEEEMLLVNCFPDKDNNDLTQADCMTRGCIFNNTQDVPHFIPKCHIDRTLHGYRRSSSADGGSTESNNFKLYLNKKKSAYTLFGRDMIDLQVHVEKNSNNILHVKITDSRDQSRYEAPVGLNLPHNEYNSGALYDTKVAAEGDDFFLKVTRKDTNATIWDTSVGPIIFSDQYLQISTKLASQNFYGLGEHRHFHLKHDMNYRTWPIFTRDAAVNSPDYTNLYGAHPFYMNLEDDKGNANAVLFLNTNAMEVLLEPLPRVTYRTIGGILDFYIFMGHSPEEVIQEYHKVIGHPVMIPYWSLGFQLCRWGYDSIDNLKAAVDRTRAAGIPQDIQYADIDHMDERKDFTYDKVNFAGLPEYVKELQDGGMHFIIILDPALISNETDYWPYDTGVTEDVFIKWPNDTGPMDSRPDNIPDSDIMLGYVWPKGKVAFPDFLNNRTKDWWSRTITRFHDTIAFDGLWIDMNEPANFDTNGERPWNWPEKDKPYWSLKCLLDNNTLDIPPYKPRSVLGEYLSEKTLCMVGQQVDGKYRHYDVHSLYGWSEMEPTLLGLRNATGERGVVISRSTFPSSGKHGAHWLGDNDSFWRNLHDSIIGIIEFNLFGMPYVGADICGFFSEPSVEMCQRWMQLGAFYTFSRNHNGKGMKEQDPALFGKHVAYSSRIAMETRYSLLPYLYTQFFRVHKEGGTVIRSMMHEFPSDRRTWEIDTQFMWAHALLIAPVLEQGQLQKDVYLPDARWFSFYTGEEMARHTTVTVDAPRDFIPLFVRGGYIIPTQEPANNTVHSRKNGMHLLVVPDDTGSANGELFWDDGVGIDTIDKGEYYFSNFQLTNNEVKYTVTKSHSVVGDLKFTHIWVYGVEKKPDTISENKATSTFYSDTKMLHISGLTYRLDSNFTISWT